MLQWKDFYATDHKIVDDQHKKLFEIVNGFEKAVRDKAAATVIQQTLLDLGNYAKTHFSAEEKEMELAKCPAAAENKAAHEDFFALYVKSLQRYQSEGYSSALADELLTFTQEWLVQHICGVDAHLKFYPSPKEETGRTC